jgi:hypothetical protein
MMDLAAYHLCPIGYLTCRATACSCNIPNPSNLTSKKHCHVDIHVIIGTLDLENLASTFMLSRAEIARIDLK